jgi:hypothetical protein
VEHALVEHGPKADHQSDPQHRAHEHPGRLAGKCGRYQQQRQLDPLAHHRQERHGEERPTSGAARGACGSFPYMRFDLSPNLPALPLHPEDHRSEKNRGQYYFYHILRDEGGLWPIFPADISDLYSCHARSLLN